MRMLEYKARQAKDQEIVVLQKYHVNSLENKVQRMISLSLQKATKEQRVPIYQYVDSIAIEDARPDCCWPVIRTVPFLQKKILQMPMSRITSCESIH